MKPIYQPTGRAGEYGDYAVNIYTGCNHGCVYCYAAKNANRWGKDFTHVEPRKGIVEATKRQIERESITGKLIHLCFTCDPYPADVDTTVTRQVIEAIKDSGNHVQILTKGGRRAQRDFDLLGTGDWFGVTFTGDCGKEPNAADGTERMDSLMMAAKTSASTWVSCEPVFSPQSIYSLIAHGDFIDRFKIGKLNHYASDTDWYTFGHEAERLCIEYGRDYLIKEDLRREMDK